LPLESGAVAHLSLGVENSAVLVVDVKDVLVEELFRQVKLFTSGTVTDHICLQFVCGKLNRPWEGASETREEQDNGPGDNHVVVDADKVAGEASGETNTIKLRVELLPNDDVTLLEDLADSELEHDHGNTQEHEAEDVGDEEGGTTVLEAQVGEPP